jgi:hypothetical protein
MQSNTKLTISVVINVILLSFVFGLAIANNMSTTKLNDKYESTKLYYEGGNAILDTINSILADNIKNAKNDKHVVSKLIIAKSLKTDYDTVIYYISPKAMLFNNSNKTSNDSVRQSANAH